MLLKDIYFFFFLGTGDLGSPTSALSTLSAFFLTGAGDGAGFKFFLSNFFCSLSFSSNSWFSLSIRVIKVLQRLCNSLAVRLLINQSNLN